MNNKALQGLAAGLVIGVALTLGIGRLTADKPASRTTMEMTMPDSAMSMDSMVASLKDKSGDDFDKEFVTQMIAHHEGAIDMANLVAARAKHQEIKDLADDIVRAQSTEISEMKTWYGAWGYGSLDGDATSGHSMHQTTGGDQ